MNSKDEKLECNDSCICNISSLDKIDAFEGKINSEKPKLTCLGDPMCS